MRRGGERKTGSQVFFCINCKFAEKPAFPSKFYCFDFAPFPNYFIIVNIYIFLNTVKRDIFNIFPHPVILVRSLVAR